MSIIDSYLNQLEFMNKFTSGTNLQQFIPSKDTSFLRGGGLPTGNGIPKSRGGLESKLYNQKQPNVRRQIEEIGEEKDAIKGDEDEENEEEKGDVLPEDTTGKSVVKLSGSTGGRSHGKTSLRDSSESPTPKEEAKMSSSSNIADRRDEPLSKGSSSVLPQFHPNLPKRVQDILKQTDQNGKPFRQGTTRSPFFVPNDESKPVQSALLRGAWKTLESKSIRSDKIGQPVPFTKDGIMGHLFFMEKSFAKKFTNN